MVYKHPISYLQDDINNIIDHGKKQIMEALKGNQRAKDKKIGEILDKMQEKIEDRSQVELQRQQRKETEDAVFISGDTIKNTDEAQDIVIDTLKKKYKSNQIGHIVQADQIPTKNKDKLLFKIQLKPKKQQEVTITGKNDKESKVSLTTALFSILREKPECAKKKGKQVDIQRQTPTYLQEKKKIMDSIAKDIRTVKKYQTKTGFNVKANTLVAKYREDKTKEWKSIIEDSEKFTTDIKKRIEETEWTDYVVDEKECIDNIINF